MPKTDADYMTDKIKGHLENFRNQINQILDKDDFFIQEMQEAITNKIRMICGRDLVSTDAHNGRLLAQHILDRYFGILINNTQKDLIECYQKNHSDSDTRFAKIRTKDIGKKGIAKDIAKDIAEDIGKEFF